MDTHVTRALHAAGIDIDHLNVASLVPIAFDPVTGQVLRPEDEDGQCTFQVGDTTCQVALPPISQLYHGTERAPDLSGFPVEYVPFFTVLEATAANVCAQTERVVTDDEFVRLYKQFRARPDGWDRNPLFAYLRAAAQLYMSLHEVSQHEFRAVTARLLKSARTFRFSKRSCNYFAHALGPFMPDGHPLLDLA